MKNDIKIFLFDEGSKKDVISREFWAFVILISLPLLLYVVVYELIEEYIYKGLIPSQINKIIVICMLILGVVWYIKYKVSVKGVVLYDDYLRIEKHFPTKKYFFNVNPKVKYEDILNCEVRSMKSDNYQDWNEKRIYFLAGMSDEYIRIETVNDRKKYLFAVEDNKECCEEIINRINNITGNSSLK